MIIVMEGVRKGSIPFKAHLIIEDLLDWLTHLKQGEDDVAIDGLSRLQIKVEGAFKQFKLDIPFIIMIQLFALT